MYCYLYTYICVCVILLSISPDVEDRKNVANTGTPPFHLINDNTTDNLQDPTCTSTPEDGFSDLTSKTQMSTRSNLNYNFIKVCYHLLI